MSLKLPKHVAIVMDGNGRWAESRGLIRVEGHKAGVDAVKAIIRCCLEKKIPYLSLFAFSSENWSRPHEEVNFLMELFIEALSNEIAELHENGIQLIFTGERQDLSASLQAEMEKAETLTSGNQKLCLNIVVNYGGKWDILSAVKKCLKAFEAGELDSKNLDEDSFANFLSTSAIPDPDLFIRTSGELRISNFFLWQLAYTELYFTEILWPDFSSAEFEKALQSFSARQRRFGLTDQQLKGNEYA